MLSPPLLAAILLLAFFLRLIELAKADLGMDGGLSVAMAAIGPEEVLLLSERDVHPPLYYLLLHYWMLFCGMTPLAAKYLGVIFGVLTVPLLYALGRRLRHPRLGLLSAMLMAISPVYVANAAAVRDFVAAGFFATLSTFIFLRVLETEHEMGSGSGWKRWAAFLLASVAELLTSYLNFGMLAAQVLFVLLRGASRQSLGRWLAALIGIAVLYAPWGWLAVTALVEKMQSRLQGPGSTGDGAGSPASFGADALRQLTTGDFLSFDPFSVEIVALLVLLFGLIAAWRRHQKGLGLESSSTFARDGFLLLALATALAMDYGIVRFWLHDALPSRYLVIASPFFLLLVARGLDSLADAGWLMPALASAVLVVGGALSLRDFYDRPPFPPSFWNPRGMVEYLDTRARDGEGLIFITLEQAGYYDSLSKRHLQWQYFSLGPSYFEVGLAERVQRLLPAAAAKHDALWLVLHKNGAGAPSAVRITDWLERNTYLSRDEWISDGVMRRYVTDRGPLVRSPLVANFGNLIRMRDAEFNGSAVPSGDVRLSLIWQAIGKSGVDYTVFVHFLDDKGKRWAQFDRPPPQPTSFWQVNDTLLDRRAVQLPDALPAGTYWLDVGLYRGEERLSLRGGGNALRVGPVVVR